MDEVSIFMKRGEKTGVSNLASAQELGLVCSLTLLKIVSINSGLLVSVFSMTDVKIDFGDEGDGFIFHVRSAAKNQTAKSLVRI